MNYRKPLYCDTEADESGDVILLDTGSDINMSDEEDGSEYEPPSTASCSDSDMSEVIPLTGMFVSNYNNRM